MRKFILLLLLMLGASAAQAQTVPPITVSKTWDFSSASSSDAWTVPTGVYYHVIRWTNPGTITPCTIRLERSDNGSTFSAGTNDLISSTSCLTSGSATVTQNSAKAVKITVITYGGSGTLNVWYGGSTSSANVINGNIQVGPNLTAYDSLAQTLYTNISTDVIGIINPTTTKGDIALLGINEDSGTTVINQYGVAGVCMDKDSTNTKTLCVGTTGEASYKGAGSAAGLTMLGVAGVSRVDSAQTVGNTISLYATGNQKTGGATVNANFGVYVEPQTIGTVNYAVYTAGSAPSAFLGGIISGGYNSVSNCSSSSGSCSGAPAGSVSIAAAATTVTVSTTAVTANSQIFIQEDSSLGTKLGVTCNTTTGRDYTVTARTASTSFLITASAAPAANPACLSYFLLN